MKKEKPWLQFFLQKLISCPRIGNRSGCDCPCNLVSPADGVRKCCITNRISQVTDISDWELLKYSKITLVCNSIIHSRACPLQDLPETSVILFLFCITSGSSRSCGYLDITPVGTYISILRGLLLSSALPLVISTAMQTPCPWASRLLCCPHVERPLHWVWSILALLPCCPGTAPALSTHPASGQRVPAQWCQRQNPHTWSS